MHHQLRNPSSPDPWRLVVGQCALAPGVSALNVMPDVLTELSRYVQSLRDIKNHQESKAGVIVFMLGRENPIYAGLPSPATTTLSGYAWYLRVPDLVAFLSHVRPALEKHLLRTPAEGYSGAVTLDFFRDGLRLDFAQGKITEVCSIDSKDIKTSDAEFPDLTFLQLLGGRRTVDQLQESYPDCIASPTAQALLTALFPPFTDNLWHSD